MWETHYYSTQEELKEHAHNGDIVWVEKHVNEPSCFCLRLVNFKRSTGNFYSLGVFGTDAIQYADSIFLDFPLIRQRAKGLYINNDLDVMLEFLHEVKNHLTA